jgi:hypothetical protein
MIFDILIFDALERVIQSFAIFFFFTCGILFINRARRNEERSERLIGFGFSNFFIFSGFIRLFMFIADYFIIGNYINHSYYGVLSNTTPNWSVILLIGSSFMIMIFLGFFFFFEKVFHKTKYILTFINIIFLIIHLTFNTLFIDQLMLAINSLIMSFVLIYITEKSKTNFQIVSVYVAIGLVLIYLGVILYFDEIRELSIFFPAFPAFIMILGSVVAISPALMNPIFFSKKYFNWALMVVVNISITIFCIFLAVVYNAFQLLSIIIIYVTFTVYPIIKISKRTKLSRKPETEAKALLGVFVRPQKVTEEEISISKEKRICLVCKNKLKSQMFMCGTCGAYYCINCSDFLSNEENSCWVCSAPIDENKPTKLDDKEAEVEIETESQRVQKV